MFWGGKSDSDKTGENDWNILPCQDKSAWMFEASLCGSAVVSLTNPTWQRSYVLHPAGLLLSHSCVCARCSSSRHHLMSSCGLCLAILVWAWRVEIILNCGGRRSFFFFKYNGWLMGITRQEATKEKQVWHISLYLCHRNTEVKFRVDPELNTHTAYLI